MKILLLLLLTVATQTVRPPSPLCRSIPLPPQIPITIGEDMRFDLEDVFSGTFYINSGYNLYLNGTNQSHITVAQKYTSIESPFPASYNFTATKIKNHGRVLGLVTNGAFSKLVIGHSRDSEGMTFDFQVQIQSSQTLHCYDVDELISHHGQFAIIDCGQFSQGELLFNQFIFVNLTDKKIIEGSHVHDTFVKYNFISKRKIQILEDPFTRLPYLLRFHLRDGVSAEHADQTYLEIFLMDNPREPQLLDVIDHTFLELPNLSIADYQIFADLIYILAYNKGVYELVLTPDQHVIMRSRFDMQSDITRFRVDRIGFNDDLNLVMSNQNTIYQYEWDVTHPPVLTNKYTLVPKSIVRQVFVDYNFVIAVTDSIINDQLTRRTWVFTPRTNSYLNAYNVFHAPLNSPHIIVWNQHGSTLHIFHEDNVFFVKMSLPYLHISPVDSSMINKTQSYTVTGISIGDDGQSLNCSQNFTFLYLDHGDKRILKTGYWPQNKLYVDSPEVREIPLVFQFYGANLTYNATFQSNSSNVPHAYVDKQHKALFKWPQEIDTNKICYYEMFTELRTQEEVATAVYGLVQTEEVNEAKTTYATFYVRCDINVFDRDQTHHLTCKNIMTTRFSMGKILSTSQMFDPEERRVAIIFDSEPHTVYVYFFWPDGFGFYGRKDYAGDAGNSVSGTAIHQGKLFVVLEYSKRVDIFELSDIYQSDDLPRNAKPRMTIISQLMRFYGVTYFAPVSIKVSRFHKSYIFLKTKTGVMALSINELSFPQLVFTVQAKNILYDFQINHRHLIMLTQQASTLYDLTTPLRRNDPPIKRNSIQYKFNLGQYDEVCSDRLFYLVSNHSAFVINPSFQSISALYTQVWSQDQILSVDAVNIKDREIFFVRTKKEIVGYVFKEDPILTIEWPQKVPDFNLSLSAYNPSAQCEPYKLSFQVIDTNQTQIVPSIFFNQTEAANLGHLKIPANSQNYSGTVQINDTHWFQGNVLNYTFECATEECYNTTTIQNHIQFSRTVVEGRAIYDIESSMDGIYAQQYASVFKTYTHNDSIHYINMIPTTRRGEVCTKLATGSNLEYVISLCQLGQEGVNIYVTTHIASKPFTFGPYQTDAKAVNYAKIVGPILMIVDNEDNPFVRSGGIMLYHLNFDFGDTQFITFLDYLDHQDLQIQGYTGTPYIGSADMHAPFWDKDHEFRLFLTESRTGAIFVFGFQASPDGQEIVYLSKNYFPLDTLIPKDIRYPSPLRVQNIVIHYAFDQGNVVDYYLLLSVANWHHMQIKLKLDHTDQLLDSRVQRLFERFPWQLQNYIKYKKGRSYSTFFAVPYVHEEKDQQLIMVYQVPFILNRNAEKYQDRYKPHAYKKYGDQVIFVPLLGSFGAHFVDGPYQTAYDFHTFGKDKLLWSDQAGNNITELNLNQNVTLTIKDRKTPKDTIYVTALNPYTNYTFMIDVNFQKETDPDNQTKAEILWIAIIVIGVVMIIAVVTAYCRQQNGQHHHHHPDALKETLITQEEERGERANNINRSSVDPESIRGSIDPIIVPSPVGLTSNNVVSQERAQDESSSSSGDEVADLTH